MDFSSLSDVRRGEGATVRVEYLLTGSYGPGSITVHCQRGCPEVPNPSVVRVAGVIDEGQRGIDCETDHR